jgi:hypothetical protein
MVPVLFSVKGVDFTKLGLPFLTGKSFSTTKDTKGTKENAGQTPSLTPLCLGHFPTKYGRATKLYYFNDLLSYGFGYCCCAVSYSQFGKDMDEMRFNSCFGNE